MRFDVYQCFKECFKEKQRMYMNSFPDLESAKNWLKSRYYIKSETYWCESRYLGCGGLFLSKTGQLFRIEEVKDE